MVVFVPFTAPGDRIRVRITACKPRFLLGELVEIIEPSQSRREPPCPVAGQCGGCAWQHVSYPEQVRQKEKILHDSLRKFKGFEWLPFLEAPHEFQYRNRIQLQVSEGKIGFFAARTRELIPIKECLIAEPALNERIKTLDAERISARRLELALQVDGTVREMADQRDPEAALFSQVNRVQNERLRNAVLERVAGFKPDWIMDLYCGSGNLTEILAARFPDVPLIAIDLSRASIERAPRLPNVEWRQGDVAQVLKKLNPNKKSGLVVLDPPRVGCTHAVTAELLRHHPTWIVYVSCNPTTFARDVERLSNYELVSVQGLDMFPQTEHVELIGSLRAATLLT